MGNTEYVDKLVAEGFFDDVERLKKELPLLAASMEQLSKAGRDVNAALGSTRTLKDVVENTDKATKVNETASRTVKVLTEDTLKLNMAIKAQNDALKLNVQIAQAQDGSIAKEILLVKQLTAERNRLNLETQKGRAEELKAQIDAKNDWIKSNSDKLSAQKINIGNYPEMMAQMAAIRNEMVQMEAAGLKGTQVFADMEGKLTEISRAMGPTSAQMAALTNSMTFLAQAGKQDTQEFKDLQQQAMALRVNMNYVKTAVSGTSDALNKQASAAKSSGQATFAVSQLLREMPSFAYSTSTGILALSNNIPMLGDSITNLKQKNEELVASGQKAIPVWKSLGLAVFSVNGIITLAVSAITIIAARMAMAGNAAKEAAEDTDSYASSLNSLNKTISQTGATINSQIRNETTSLNRLLTIYRDAAVGGDLRVKTYNKLQSMYPSVLQSLSDEEIKTRKITAAHEAGMSKLKEYLEVKIKYQQGEKALQQSIDAAEKGKAEIPERYKALSSREKEIAKIISGNQYLTDLQIKNYANYSAEDTYSTSEIENARAYNKMRLELANTETTIVFLKKAQAEGQKQLLELDVLQEKSDKKKKERKEKEFEIDYDNLINQKNYVVLAQTREQYEQEVEAKFQQRLAVTKDIEEALQDQRTGALNELNKQHGKGAISYETYSKSKEDMDKRFVYTSLILHKAYYEELLKEYPGDPRLQALISKANKELADLYAADAANFQKEQQKKKKEIEDTHKHMKDLVREAVQQSIDTSAAFVDGYYQKQIDAQQRLLDSINQRKDAEIDAINLTMQSDEKKHNQIRALNAQTAQQEKQIQAEMRRLKREQAQADRVAGVLNVVLNTSIAVARALKDYAWPYSLIPAGIVAGMGAAQIAAIYAQPLPQYAEGTEDHPGGHALVGEAGKEAIMEPGKDPYIVDKPTVLNLRRHARVIPEKDLIAGGMGFLTPGLLQQINAAGGDMTEVKQAIDNSTRSITQAITNKPETTFIASNGEFKKIVKRGNSYITYLNDNFN